VADETHPKPQKRESPPIDTGSHEQAGAKPKPALSMAERNAKLLANPRVRMLKPTGMGIIIGGGGVKR
jgi:hypothetical protein